jgi:hypothetical protein
MDLCLSREEPRLRSHKASGRTATSSRSDRGVNWATSPASVLTVPGHNAQLRTEERRLSVVEGGETLGSGLNWNGGVLLLVTAMTRR